MTGIFPPAAVRITLSPFFKSNRYSPSFCRVNVALPAFTTGFAISVRRIHGSPARLLIRMKLVFPPFRTADTRKAPSVLRSLNCTSFHWEGTAGNTRIFPPQLCSNMSCMHCAPDNGVSITGPLSIYMVLGRRVRANRPLSFSSALSPSPNAAYSEEAPV